MIDMIFIGSENKEAFLLWIQSNISKWSNLNSYKSYGYDMIHEELAWKKRALSKASIMQGMTYNYSIPNDRDVLLYYAIFVSELCFEL